MMRKLVNLDLCTSAFSRLSFRPLATVSNEKRLVDEADNRFCKLEKREMKEDSRRTGVLAFKRGMMTHYDKWGYRHPVTVLDLSNCQVLGSFKLGDSIVQEMGIGEKSIRQMHHAQLNYYSSLHVAPKLVKQGFSVTQDALIPPGTYLRSAHFLPGQLVDVQAKSIGKGFQGAMKRWGFAGMPATHGTSLTHRALGATGCRSVQQSIILIDDPGRVFKGKKMAGRMGGKNVTAKRLRILKIDHALNCLMVRGAVPGHDGTVVRVMDTSACKRDLYRIKEIPFPTFIADPENPLPREQVAEFFEKKDPLFIGTNEK